MASGEEPFYTAEEYLERERRAETKHEYRDEATRDRWSLAVFESPDAILTLPSIDCTVLLRDVYERVELPPSVPLRAVYEDAVRAEYVLSRHAPA